MSGKPAARQGDMTQYGGSIVQGSAGVRIGAPTGVACSVCPGGVTSGHPVNPLLGAKVLPGETDIALSAPTGTITTVSTGWCTTRGHNMQSRWSKVAIFTTRWAAGWQNGCGGVNGT